MNRISFLEPEIMGGVDEPRLQTPMFFVGIQREMAPPVFFGRSRLHKMRVILVEADQAAGMCQETGQPKFEMLPTLPAPPHHLALQPRLVHGEILRGENDELYERVGNRIRRLRNLAAGPSGELLDVIAPPAHTQEGCLQQTEGVEGEGAAPQAPALAAGFRKLLPEPGERRLVPLGAFKQMLASQLAHPERLRDGHRLPCYVQVFETAIPQRLEQLAAAIFGEAARGRLQPLTQTVARQLQLAPMLPPPARAVPPAPRSPGMLLPGDRLISLQVESDPTSDQSVHQETSESAGILAGRALKTSIPERFAKPWEFQTGREEALYDLSCASTFWGSLADRFGRLIHGVAFHRDFRKWQVLLNGRSSDEQLWSVRPPRGGLTHGFVLAWAKQALELGGYDPRNMLNEWQIFWRRKGA
jgi:hypothetical protein